MELEQGVKDTIAIIRHALSIAENTLDSQCLNASVEEAKREMDSLVLMLNPMLCGGPKPYAPRSSAWPHTRKLHLELQPYCMVCGKKEDLEVHHILPFHLHPNLELDQENLITLCENMHGGCHLLFGHCMNWKAYNANLREDIKIWQEKIKNRSYE